MARVFNLMADWAGSGRYRAIIPSIALAQLGHEVMCASKPNAKDRNDKTFAATADVFIGHRVESIEGSKLWQALAKDMRTALMVLDLDDNIWNVHQSNNAYGLNSPERFARNAECADIVTACSYGLAEIITSNSSAKNVAVLPNCVPEEMLNIPREPAKEVIRLIFGGSASHVLDIPILKRIFPKLDYFHLRMLGNVFSLGLSPLRIEYGPWTENLVEYYTNIDGDIGLAPLEDDPFNYGKSDLKVLEYMARGIPFVASNRGPYAEIAFLHEKAGFFVKTDAEWIDAITTLMQDESLRQRLGETGREWVRQNRVASVGAAQREKLFGISHLRGDAIYGEAP